MEEQKAGFGRKVFFLNPPPVIGEVANNLVEAEFEVYSVKQHQKLARYLVKNPESLVFVNIDEDPDEAQWRAWIRKLREDDTTKAVNLGVFTMLGDEELKKLYLMEIGIQCGYITLKMGAAKTAEILMKTLEANEARGRRKYIRTVCPNESAEFNCTLDDKVMKGRIADLSSVGMAAMFYGHAPKVGSRLVNLQLSLKGSRITMNGVIVGGRSDPAEGDISVVMFEPASLSDEKKTKIRAFIRKLMQTEMDSVMESS